MGTLKILLQPNPAVDNGQEIAAYQLYLAETNGVGITLTSLTFDNDATNYPSDLLPSKSVEARKTLTVHLQTRFQSPLTSAIDETSTFRGSDNQGNNNLEWRALLRYAPFANTAYGDVNLEFKPNPVFPADDGRNAFNLLLTETNNVGINVTDLTVNGQDVKSVLPSICLGPPATLSTSLYFTQTAMGYCNWVLRSNDDNGHTGLKWTGRQYVLDFVPLLNGTTQQHVA